jgi:hypothetical protein
MRYVTLALSLFLLPSAVAAATSTTPRPLDPIAAEAFAQALDRSAIVRSLVATLEASNVIVHIESSAAMPVGIGGMTRFVASRGGYRYVRITIHAQLWGRDRIATLAHELQHACEVANSSAADYAGVRQLFERAGHRTGPYYETDEAANTGRSVLAELREPRHVAALPADGAHPGRYQAPRQEPRPPAVR